MRLAAAQRVGELEKEGDDESAALLLGEPDRLAQALGEGLMESLPTVERERDGGVLAVGEPEAREALRAAVALPAPPLLVVGLPPVGLREGVAVPEVQAVGQAVGVLGGEGEARGVAVGAVPVGRPVWDVEAERHSEGVPEGVSPPLTEGEPEALGTVEGSGGAVAEGLPAAEALALALRVARGEPEGLGVGVGARGVAVLQGCEGEGEPDRLGEGRTVPVTLPEALRVAEVQAEASGEAEAGAEAGALAVPQRVAVGVAVGAPLLLEEPL